MCPLFQRSCSFALISLAVGCQATEATDVSTSNSSIPMSSLIASQNASYGVPAGAGDVSFTSFAAMAAVQWSGLSELQLSDWFQIWTTMLSDSEGLSHNYVDPSGATVDLFALSPKDGYCVAFAMHMDGGAGHACVNGFMKSL